MRIFTGLLMTVFISEATSITITNWTTSYSGIPCSSDSQCEAKIGYNTSTGDPGFDTCCATLTVFNGTSKVVSGVSLCLPRFIADDSNGSKSLSLGSYNVTAACKTAAISTSTTCTSESGCSAYNGTQCCVTRGWSLDGDTYNSTSMVCRPNSLYLTQNQFFNYVNVPSNGSVLNDSQFFALCTQSANP